MQLSTRLARLSHLGLPARLLLFAVPLFLLALVLTSVGWALSGWIGVAAVAIAFVSCLVGSLAAVSLSFFLQGSHSPLQELLVGMLFRMGVPMGAALVVVMRSPTLDEAGFVFYLLPFFLVAVGIHALTAVGLYGATVKATVKANVKATTEGLGQEHDACEAS